LKQTKNPFDDFDKAEFKMRFRLAKIIVKKLLEEVGKLRALEKLRLSSQLMLCKRTCPLM